MSCPCVLAMSLWEAGQFTATKWQQICSSRDFPLVAHANACKPIGRWICNQLVEFVAEGGENAKKVFVAMGEERASLFLVQRLRDYLGVDAVAPEQNEETKIEF